MFYCLLTFTWRRLIRAENQDATLDRDYRLWSRYVLDVFGIDLTISGRENIPAPGSRKLVIMSNHQSQLDIPCLVTVMDRRIGFVAKRELSRIPVLNYFMQKVGCVFIDRADRRSAQMVLERAAREMGDNPLVVFPEGTRSKDGNLLPLKQGGCRLAILADAVILPVLIQGTRDAGESRPTRSRAAKSRTSKSQMSGRSASNGSATIPVSLRLFPVFDSRGLGDGKAAFNQIRDYVEKCWRSPNDRT